MNNETNMLIFQTEEGNTKIDVRLENETVWMTQKAIAELYQKVVNTINGHIKNIFAEGELHESTTIRKNRIVQTEGNRDVEREVSFYNLEMIIAIGYRVRSHRGTQFRQWATEHLNEYLVKGFTMDDDRLKEIRNFGDVKKRAACKLLALLNISIHLNRSLINRFNCFFKCSIKFLIRLFYIQILAQSSGKTGN
ncbi:virulence RhuM family protein [Virgibacillus profundi]|uniref:virulence RhuM family protein n=1 Tax=Virgibacillus profundi TaxID=2024555 RepID=UPI001F0B5E43|nr:RhuM family protein [Virgibacillus profundi]